MVSPFASVVPEDSTDNALAIPLGTPAEVFKAGGSMTFVRAVREHVEGMALDISTKEARTKLASVAYQIARTKTAALSVAKNLSDEFKNKAKEIDTEAKWMASELDKLKHETRQPLTDWENKDAERNAGFELKLGEILHACLFVGVPNVAEIQQRMAMVRSYQLIDWQEFSGRAKIALAQTIPTLEAMLCSAEAAEAQRAELEELRQLKASMEPGPAPKPIEPIRDPEPTLVQPIPPQPANLTQADVRFTIAESLCRLFPFLDYDQAADIVSAIAAAKIPHLTIN